MEMYSPITGVIAGIGVVCALSTLVTQYLKARYQNQQEQDDNQRRTLALLQRQAEERREEVRLREKVGHLVYSHPDTGEIIRREDLSSDHSPFFPTTHGTRLIDHTPVIAGDWNLRSLPSIVRPKKPVTLGCLHSERVPVEAARTGVTVAYWCPKCQTTTYTGADL